LHYIVYGEEREKGFAAALGFALHLYDLLRLIPDQEIRICPHSRKYKVRLLLH